MSWPWPNMPWPEPGTGPGPYIGHGLIPGPCPALA